MLATGRLHPRARAPHPLPPHLPTELWFEKNRRPLDPLQLAVKEDIENLMAAERERQQSRARVVSAKTLRRLARPHAPPGTEERRENRKAAKGLDVWAG